VGLASHSGSCEQGCADQRSRQKFKFSHSISPLDLKKPTALAPLWKWRSDRPIKVTFAHAVSMPREFGAGASLPLAHHHSRSSPSRRIELREAEFSGGTSLPAYIWLEASEHSDAGK
jgi:hypothetical protein